MGSRGFVVGLLDEFSRIFQGTQSVNSRMLGFEPMDLELKS